MSLASLLRDAASRVPNKPALYMKDRVLTYAELDGEAQCLARRLIACGTKPGDRVALHMENGAEIDRKSTRLNSSHRSLSRMPSSA